MRSFFYIGVISSGLLFAAPLVTAQRLGPIPVFGLNPVDISAIGPDGTFYALAPATGSTGQNPVTGITAISPLSGTAPKWTATLTGLVARFLPGATSVFVVQNSTSGSGRSTTISTSVTLLSAATGAPVTASPITLPGGITDIQIKTVGTTDYLYVTSAATSTSTSGGTTTLTTTATLTIYSQTGVVIKAVTL